MTGVIASQALLHSVGLEPFGPLLGRLPRRLQVPILVLTDGVLRMELRLAGLSGV